LLDLTEQGGDLVRPVILDLARGSAGATQPDRMVPALGRDDFLLDQSHKPLALRQSQAQIRNVAQSPGRSITITSTLRLDPSTPVSTRRKTHPILDPQPAKNSAGHTQPATAPPIARQSLS